MKKKIFLIAFMFVITLTIFLNSYIEIDYNVTLLELFNNKTSLTAHEKEYLKQMSPLIYASDNNSPPLRFVDNESNQYKGIVLDYIQSLSIELGTDIDVQPMVWKNAIETLKSGKSHICDMFPSDERSNFFIYSDPIYSQRSIILKMSDNNNIKSSSDLEHSKVAVQRGDYVIEYLNSKFEKLNLVYTKDYEESIELLVSGEIDAVVGDEPVITYFTKKKGLQETCTIIERPLYERDVVLSFNKNEKELRDIVNKGVYALKRKKTMAKIQQKWFGISALITHDNNDKKINLMAAFFLVNSIIIIAVFYTFNSSLKNEVNTRTKELTMYKNDLQTIFDGIAELMIVVDRNGKVRNCNQAFCDYFNRSIEGIIDRPFVLFSNKLGSLALPKAIDKTFEDCTNQSITFSISNNSFDVDIYPLKDIDEDVDRALVMIKDITESTIIRNNMIQSNKMAAVGKLAAGVAHEIRNPLGLIRNYTYILKNKLGQEDEIVSKSLRVIESSVERSNKIIDNLLNFSRLSDLTIKNINLFNFFNNILSLSNKLMEKNSKAVNIVCDKELRVMTYADSLRHVVMNAINNAIDAIGESGQITIFANTENDQLHIRIIDNGCGINENDIDNVFNPFHTTKEPGKGTGLGMFVAYNEVSRMNGKIFIKSKENIGTTVHIMVPINDNIILKGSV